MSENQKGGPEVTGRGRRWKGPHEPMTADQQRLAVQWLALAYGQARAWSKSRPLLKEEFISAAMLALVEAARNYDPSINKAFLVYLKWHLRHARKEVLRVSAPKGYRVTGCLRAKREAINRRRPTLVEWDHHREHALGSVHGGFGDVDLREWIDHHLGRVSKDHVNICVQIYVYGRYPQEIAGELGWPCGEVLRVRDEGLAALREALEREGDAPRPRGPEGGGALGEIVRSARTVAGIGAGELAASCGVTEECLRGVEERGERPGRRLAVAIARALELQPDVVLSLAGHKVGGKS